MEDFQIDLLSIGFGYGWYGIDILRIKGYKRDRSLLYIGKLSDSWEFGILFIYPFGITTKNH